MVDSRADLMSSQLSRQKVLLAPAAYCRAESVANLRTRLPGTAVISVTLGIEPEPRIELVRLMLLKEEGAPKLMLSTAMGKLTLTITFGLLFSVFSFAQEETTPATAGANLIDAQGRGVGQASLQETPHGVLLKLELKNATPGIHGLHIHDVARCDRPSFESAGGHFNPSKKQHGFLIPGGPHAGDLPNIEVPATTQLSVEYLLDGVTLRPGPQSLLDASGTAIVIHAGKDDYMTDPAGESGNRLACGEIVRSQAK